MWNYELVSGLICCIIGILLGVREIKLWNSAEQNDYIRKSFSIQKNWWNYWPTPSQNCNFL